jgi:RNA-binding protein
MPPLTPALRRELRAKAHHLHPVVIVGQHGLTATVLREVDVALRAHQLIKVRVFSDARDEREALLQRICSELDAAAVQHIGKLLIVWRPAPEPEADEAADSGMRPRQPARRGRTDVKAKGSAMAKTTPLARRPKSPLARTTRGKTKRAPASIGRTPSEQARRRRRGGKAGG